MLNLMHAANRDRLISLDQGERFVICAVRRLIAESGPDGVLLDDCFRIFDEDGEAGLKILSIFLSLLGRSARRTFDIGSPGNLIVTWDEHRILSLLGAAHGARKIPNPVLLDAHLRWLARPQQRHELGEAATQLAQLLAAHGHGICRPAVNSREYDDGGLIFAEGLSLVPQSTLNAQRYPAFMG